MPNFSLLNYLVENDLRPGVQVVLQAKSHWDALVAGAKLSNTSTKHVTPGIYSGRTK
jgi:hypothetical protein